MICHQTIRLLGLALVAAFALTVIGCNATIGVGVAVPYHGPWYGGFPIYP